VIKLAGAYAAIGSGTSPDKKGLEHMLDRVATLIAAASATAVQRLWPNWTGKRWKSSCGTTNTTCDRTGFKDDGLPPPDWNGRLERAKRRHARYKHGTQGFRVSVADGQGTVELGPTDWDPLPK
jgi:hypothetical protein